MGIGTKMSLAFALAILGGLTSMVYIAPQLLKTTFVQSSIDERWYKVKKGPNQQTVADTLARIRKQMFKLITYCMKHGPEEWKEPLQKINLDAIAESDEQVGHVAYTINKGEAIHFCVQKPSMDKTKDTPEIESDMNTFMFVAIHELAHVVTKSTGHTEEFWQNHYRLLRYAEKANVYTPVDYTRNPTSYCGVKINTSHKNESNENNGAMKMN